MERNNLDLGNSQSLAYWYENVDSTKTCFFVHGLGDSISSFLNIKNLLYPFDINILLYDLPGFGENRNLDLPFEHNLVILKDLVGLHNNEKNYFVGHSMGGLILLLTLLYSKLDYQRIIAIEPSITSVDHSFFRFVQEKPEGIGFDEFVNTNRASEGYAPVYYENLKKCNPKVFKNCVRTINDNFEIYSQAILSSGISFSYVFGLNSAKEEREKIGEIHTIEIKSFENAGHWVHIDAEEKFLEYLISYFSIRLKE